jgi:hypothetical protein
MTPTNIDYSAFKLPLLPDTAPAPDDDEDEESPSKEEVLEAMQERIPANAIFIGSLNEEICNWTSWELDDHFYLLPWKADGFEWALFRISWDDNWGRYEWEPISRISGVTEAKNAVRAMMDHWITKCGMDGPDNPPYGNLADEF